MPNDVKFFEIPCILRISKNQKLILCILPTTRRATLLKGTSSLRLILLIALFHRLSS